MTAAPLWDGKRQEYSGMLTVTDFVEIFIEFYLYLTKEEFEAALDLVTIREWNRTRRIKPQMRHPKNTEPTTDSQNQQPAHEERQLCMNTFHYSLFIYVLPALFLLHIHNYLTLHTISECNSLFLFFLSLIFYRSSLSTDFCASRCTTL